MAVAVRPRVQYKDLREYLNLLEGAGLLARVAGEVDLKHEIGALCSYGLDRRGPGLLFENVKGYPGRPLASNIIYSIEQLGLVFNTEPDVDRIYEAIVEGHRNRVPSVVLDSGPCKEEKFVGDAIDLYELPTPWWHELDGGPYIATAAGIVDRDPDNGVLNLGTYRCMIVDRHTLTLSGQIAPRIEKNEARGLPTQVAVVVGMDPLLTLVSGSPVAVDEQGQMEYEVAGAWRGAPTELVKCETSDLLVPAQAEYVVEGEVRPGERIVEGPHGEAAGFYGQNLDAFRIHVKCVTHRHNPINYGIICLLEEDYPRWLFRSGAFQDQLRRQSGLPGIKQAYFPELGGRSWGGCIIAAEIDDPGDPRRIVDAAWAITPNRWVIVVDADCDVRNWNDVMWRVVTAVRPGEDVYTGQGIHEAEGGNQRRADDYDIDSQVPDPTGLNASFKFKFRNLPPINKVTAPLRTKAAARWRELGLP
ncbi:MAG TPA: UbiD family decarboxylase [Chloroflexota bacterium]|jgi:UbiD family decarboxylase